MVGWLGGGGGGAKRNINRCASFHKENRGSNIFRFQQIQLAQQEQPCAAVVPVSQRSRAEETEVSVVTAEVSSVVFGEGVGAVGTKKVGPEEVQANGVPAEAAGVLKFFEAVLALFPSRVALRGQVTPDKVSGERRCNLGFFRSQLVSQRCRCCCCCRRGKLVAENTLFEGQPAAAAFLHSSPEKNKRRQVHPAAGPLHIFARKGGIVCVFQCVHVRVRVCHLSVFSTFLINELPPRPLPAFKHNPQLTSSSSATEQSAAWQFRTLPRGNGSKHAAK